MKKLIYTLGLGLLGCTMGVSLQSCSNDDLNAPATPAEPQEEGYFLTMDLKVPTGALGTRASALEGTEAEKTVSSIDLYFLDDATGKVILAKTGVSGFTATEPNQTTSNKDKTYKLHYDVTNELESLTALCNHDVRILVVCNASEAGVSYTLNTTTANDPKEVTFTASSSDFMNNGTKGRPMLMCSASQSNKITVFKDIDATVPDVRTVFNDGENSEKTIDLGSIDVERAMARFDLRDRPSGNNFKYQLGEDEEYKSEVYLKLYSVQLFNGNNSSYLVRQKTSGGTDEAASGARVLFGTDEDWIADPTWTDGPASYGKSSNNFFNKLSDIKANSSVTNAPVLVADIISPATSRKIDNTSGYGWCYVPENTIPSTNLMKDGANREANATGVVCKFVILNKGGNEPLTASNTAPDEIKIDGEGNAFIYLSNGKWQKAETDGTNYFLTYYGFITHNEVTASEAKMKYGVVRNNVYQFYVTSVKKLPNANEAEEYFLDLTIDVLKWQLRDVKFDF